MQQPTSTFKHLGVDATFLFGGSGKKRWALLTGVTPPANSYGYTQTLGYLAFGPEWQTNGTFRFYFGAGYGAWFEEVSGTWGLIPSVMTRAGLRAGLGTVGIHLGILFMYGPIRVFDLISFTAWPLFASTGGVYVSF